MLGCVVAGDAIKRRVQEQMELWEVSPLGGFQRHGGRVTNGYDYTRHGWAQTAGWP
jgi:type III pantothenate kinase